ncbi:MAG: hypothetical protein HWD85_01045 [Flavobacteriaceae bacterium]|nr:hypothetical protein [Flavobacteriaceae bacterium]
MAIVAYYFFNLHTKNTNNQRKFEAFTQRKKDALPIKLQAYERMLLFCERINPIKLVVRIKPIGESTEDYLQLLIKNVEQEFEHNTVQQIYITDDCWNLIITAKTASINKLKTIANQSLNTQAFREKILNVYQHESPATDTAIAFIKSEVKKLI